MSIQTVKLTEQLVATARRLQSVAQHDIITTMRVALGRQISATDERNVAHKDRYILEGFTVEQLRLVSDFVASFDTFFVE